MTKIDIFSGFLGAGKTTLIKKLISEAYRNEKLVLIENEFGDIGIDGGFLKDSGIMVNEMNSGCICCSLVGDFGEALNKVISEYNPDRILIEPSGVGKLSDIIKAVKSLDFHNIILNSYTTVVDANKCKMYIKNFGEFYNDQICNAGCIILSHTANINEEKLNECLKLVKSQNDDATIITTDWKLLDGLKILETMEKSNSLVNDIEKLIHNHDEECECGHHHYHDHDEECECGHHHHHDHDEECECGHHHHHDHDEECECGHHHHHHHADEVFTSWGKETINKYSTDIMNNILNKLSSDDYGIILRAKGIVQDENEKWVHFDYVPGEPDVRYGSSEVIGRICVIGSNLDENKLAELFRI